jgi:hypothetical protein
MAVNNLNTPGVGIQPSLIDAKGDLLVGTANDAIDRLGVTGTTGAVLTADAGETTGLKWAAAGSVGGLVHINTTTFSSVASQIIDDVFSSTYNNYEIKINLTGASATDSLLNLFFRDATPADVTTNYSNERVQVNSTFVQGQSETNSWGAVSTTYPTNSNWNISIYNPFLSAVTTWNSFGNYRANNGNPFFQIRGGMQTSTTSFRGIKILPASGNISGTIRIYGVKNQ